MTLQVFKVLTLRKRKRECTGAVPGRFTHGKERYLPNGPHTRSLDPIGRRVMRTYIS